MFHGIFIEHPGNRPPLFVFVKVLTARIGWGSEISLLLKIFPGYKLSSSRIIETVFYPINVNDALDIVKSPDGYFSFQTSGLKMGKDIENNLVVKAYRLLEKELNIPPVHIYLLKKIENCFLAKQGQR